MGFHYEIIDHVQLAAPKGGEMKARAFYGDVLGFEEVEKPDTLKKRGGVWFQAGSIHMHIGIDDPFVPRSEEHTSELQSRGHLVCRLLLEKKNSLVTRSS